MMPEIFVIVGVVCFSPKNLLVENWESSTQQIVLSSNTACIETVKISTSPVTVKGQTVKRLCDFVGHQWKSAFVWSDNTESNVKRGQECIFCPKKRRKVVSETWEDVP